MIRKVKIQIFRMIEKYENFRNKLYLSKLKLFGTTIGKNVIVYGQFKVVGNPKNLTIGDNVTINDGVFLNCGEKLYIGDNTRLSSFVKIYTVGLEEDVFPRRHIGAPVYIGNHVWIASNALVSLGVSIGDFSIVAASSVVIKDIEEKSVYAGIPAKKIKNIKPKYRE